MVTWRSLQTLVSEVIFVAVLHEQSIYACFLIEKQNILFCRVSTRAFCPNLELRLPFFLKGYICSLRKLQA